MKQYWKLSLAGIGAVLIVGLIYAQAPSPEPLPDRDKETADLVDLAYDIYKEMRTLDDDMSCHLNYTLETVTRVQDDSLLTSKADVSLYASAEQIFFESSDVLLYQDSTVGITILPSRKEIQLFPSSSNKLGQDRADMLRQGFYHQLFVQSQVVESKQVGAKGDHQLVLAPQKEFQEMYGITQIAITLNPEERRLHSVHVDYKQGSRYEAVTMTYNSADYFPTVGADNLYSKSSILEQVFDPNGRLRSEYQDFAVVDLRSEASSK
ncbi:MAG: hypothetical protein KDD67_01770 [Ignavibacteriae bacterium]|nr:hypothetical protein [Ignavibacteriota bacterium]MCB9215454.1 hypothetical protein [Ignavibacteria bacterium]